MITFAITSCKRPSLLKRSVNSFLNSCLDLPLISQWICIDDNSPEDDREEMKRLYPFFEFIFKGEENKGHARSMNILLKNIKNKYFFQTEDDWVFLQKKTYLSDCLEILNEDERYGQVVMNRNYAEHADQVGVDLVGGFRKRTKISGKSYVTHEFHKRGSESEKEFWKNNPTARSSCYWPHFSLNPSLIKVDIFNKVGTFNEDVSHFEMEFAGRYTDKNYLTCFQDGIFVSHTGRSNADRDNKEIKNAYELNGTKQF